MGMQKGKFNLFTFIRNNLLAGITILLPLWAVYIVVRFIVTLVNDALLNPILNVLSPYLAWADPRYVTLSIKFIIFLAILFLITLLGVLVKNFFVRRILNFGEGILMKVPFVNKIYVAMQQLSKTFLMKKQPIFRRAVLVEYPHKGIYALGLVTSDAEGEIQYKTSKELISVFIPTTPNPTSGFLLFVPKEEIIELQMSVENSLKLIISGGAVIPPYEPSRDKQIAGSRDER